VRAAFGRIARIALVGVALVAVPPAAWADAEPEPLALTADVLPSFRIGHPEETRFGQFEFVGGFELGSSGKDVGGLSSLVVDPGGKGLLAISDNGQMIRADIARDGAGRPVGLENGFREELTTTLGRALYFKWEADTESIDVTVREGQPVAAISFEGEARVMTGPMEDNGFVGRVTPLRLPPDVGKVRFTKGLESLAFPPAGSPLEGAVVVIAERSERSSGVDDQPGWVVGKGKPIRFRVKSRGGFDVTDAKFGPDGDLYILERLYSLAEGVRARIRRLPAAEIANGAVLDGPDVLLADLSDQIDNMEGLAFWKDGEGRDMVSLLSDDNRSILQRTLYLEFRMVR
jgi:hypothetical protein